jgi:hypothetical protein
MPPSTCVPHPTETYQPSVSAGAGHCGALTALSPLDGPKNLASIRSGVGLATRRYDSVEYPTRLHSWEQICERNAAKNDRTRETTERGLDVDVSLSSRYGTERAPQNGDRFAHNPEVAGSNPVPATT